MADSRRGWPPEPDPESALGPLVGERDANPRRRPSISGAGNPFLEASQPAQVAGHTAAAVVLEREPAVRPHRLPRVPVAAALWRRTERARAPKRLCTRGRRSAAQRRLRRRLHTGRYSSSSASRPSAQPWLRRFCAPHASSGSQTDLLQTIEAPQPPADSEVLRIVDHHLRAQRARFLVLPAGCASSCSQRAPTG